ncbi:hypothetical protein B5F10_02095 [Anaerotruncus colihominis]|uniref:Guanylate kinase-like domain-containing protein n=2 Tax=Anaerotruncus colihominis TaxID=169435 RepID=A0A1Y4MPT0_9FIRM|nr:AAA family ATPase [Anaerotruncus colihominis]OUP70716.1 hypothetical protein B5F11_04525 [Anaerotruncus colihominis]OUP75948.1 hypothetical protein B5F10_02095 [Anaerotruncus colihominis]
MNEYIFSRKGEKMSFESILITGTSCAGKSTIAQKLCSEVNILFKQVRAITTRDRREGDLSYEYVSNEEFNQLLANQKLLVNSTYRGEKYGIKKEEYNKVLSEHKIPLLIITPVSATELLEENQEKYMSIFLDSPDDILLNRLIGRSRSTPDKKAKKAFFEQNETDRKYQDKTHYIVNNIDLESTVRLITLLWEYRNRGGALSQKIITAMIKCGMLLKNADTEMVNGASYDLRLGDEYYYDGKIQKLSDKKPFLTIEPYDYAIVSCTETAWMPRDIIAKFGLTVGLFCQGVILSNGPQIDPGFCGTLFCLLFNTSNRAVHLKRGKHYATIEFNKLIGYAEPYEGKYKGKTHIIDYIPENALHGAINELKKEVEQLKTENRIMQNIYLGVVALMFAIISILLVLK